MQLTIHDIKTNNFDPIAEYAFGITLLSADVDMTFDRMLKAYSVLLRYHEIQMEKDNEKRSSAQITESLMQSGDISAARTEYLTPTPWA